MEHTYVQIDKDVTVECRKYGLRNSDPSRNDYINCKK